MAHSVPVADRPASAADWTRGLVYGQDEAMTELEGAAVVFAPLFAIFGVCFIVFHQHISDAARKAYEDQGRRIGPQTQSPGLMIVGGIGMLIISTLIVLYAFTDVFPPPPPQ